MQNVPYAIVVGSLMYVMVCTRLDIAHVIGIVSQFLSNSDKKYWVVVKWILRYFSCTSNVCFYFGNSNSILNGIMDANMVGGNDFKKPLQG